MYICTKQYQTMPKIKQNKPPKNVHLHIVKARKFIEEHLPNYYVRLVLEKLHKDGNVTNHMVRNVKKNRSDRLDILEAMVEVAKENKKQTQKFITKITTEETT